MPRPLSPGRWLLRTLEESATPLVAFDGQRRIVFVSRSLTDWVGAEGQQLIGLRANYHSGGDDRLTEIAAGLCPPPEAFAGLEESGSVSRPAVGDRPFEQRPARFVQLAGKKEGDGLLLAVVQPTAHQQGRRAKSGISPERLHALLLQLRSQFGRRFHTSQIIGDSDVIGRVREQVQIATHARTRVLIVGPAGSGREHVARTIHYAQAAASIGPLIPIACQLIDAEQMQAALAGLLRRQNDTPTERFGAALLLDVDRLRPDAQQELAGFLNLPNIELRTLATSRVSLVRLAAKGKYRRDLAYMLSTLTIVLPPLRSRQADIPLLAQHFLEEKNAAGGRQLSGFAPAAMELLLALKWPGNIDELAQAVGEACERAAGPHVAVTDLPSWAHLAKGAVTHPPREELTIRLDEFLAETEKELLARALRAARGNKSRAARLLGINRPRLLRLLTQHGLIARRPAEEPVVFEPLPEEPS